MRVSFFQHLAATALLVASSALATQAQDYISLTTGKPVELGKAPNMKVKLLSTSGQVKTYVLIFSKGDEIVSGLTEFAQKYNVKSAHYQAIGDALSVKVGVFDYGRKAFKVIPFNDPIEVTSLTGDVAVYNGKPVAHTHVNLATFDGLLHGGHLFELVSGPTVELFVTVEPTPLYKKLNTEFDAAIIDPELTK
ncbi:PPC domain-containing DNA-binding protein [Hymenobacter sp. GOD-10R]|uniref:PPC domain-containing DNA-binding protein n=1 Tax=Hymenobacter sp. GOD-10R TaxID=3093922 RepID=UPI002D77A8F2|nr:PPC domain-containing DNA-binding protein [Hymenobacter sp. GOD-10R]WRQ31666.1 PPC domain-containing DNA-binding protein [Hymenobacter sp. GOD-10R]